MLQPELQKQRRRRNIDAPQHGPHDGGPHSSKFVVLVLFCADKIQNSILGFVVTDIARRILLLVISKVCALSCVSKLQRDTTSLVKGIAIETFRTKYKGTKLYSGPPNLADEGWKKREVIAVFDVMAHLATMKVGTPSLLDDENDDKNPVTHVSKSTKLGREGKSVAAKKPKTN